jgi:chromatin structure-remodeling complex subunit RSC1/2
LLLSFIISRVLIDTMPTLRTRASRGELPDPSQTPPSARKSKMRGDAIEVRESIEAKGDMDDDVEMEDADKGDVDADGESDVDADGEPDDVEPERGPKSLLQLIESSAHYLSNYEEE